MTDRLPIERGLDLLFEDGKEIVYYDSFEDAIEKINYYSSNEVERLQIARNGYKKVVSNHTTSQRLDAVLEQFNKK
jgi:spore maturation protein CgeB